jgi:endonuclease/exonuclease/phosphatase family metal-dependent hydrolase
MKFTVPRRRVTALPLFLFTCSVTIAAASGCTSHHEIARRQTAEVGGLAWFGPLRAADRARLDRWAGAVGPPLVVEQARAAEGPVRTLVVLSWNVALGAGDVQALVSDVRETYEGSPMVLLLQEVFREGPQVPSRLEADAAFAGRLGSSARPRDDVEEIARACGLNAYYVPSMRNGSPAASNEDRGNAILSTLPLTDIGAIELPFERQRRVAVAATAEGRAPNGAPWRIRFVSAHLDNMVGPRRLWFAGGAFARTRQARALLDHLRHDETAILGGDFNTWFGFADPAFRETSEAFPDTEVVDRRPTFHNLLRLDHVFFRVPDGWKTEFKRGRSRYGSDHWPLVATIAIGADTAGLP